MPRFMLDTNTVSYALRGDPPSVRDRLRRIPMAQVRISCITEAEFLLGLALKPEAIKLVAAHALSSGMTLVTSDHSFRNLRPRLPLADWSKPR
jgi:predicted nucleic acid-binding protein